MKTREKSKCKSVEAQASASPRATTNVQNSLPGSELLNEKAVLNFSLPAGWSHAELIQEIAKQLDWRVEDPLPERLSESSFPRDRTVFGVAEKLLDDIADTYGLDWIVIDGALRFTANERVVSVAPPPISAEFLEYRESENRKQRQLADIGTQIDNATQAVVRCLLDNPLADPLTEKQRHLLALQERLAALNEILARLVKRQSLPTDGQQWSVTRIEALALLEKTGQSDVVMAGLPEKLPGDETESQSLEFPGDLPQRQDREREAGARKRLSRSEVTKILESKGWSLRDFATQAKVDPHTVTNYMKARTTPYRSTRKKIADALGVSPESLPD